MYSIIKCCIEMFFSTLVFIFTFLVSIILLAQIPDRYWLIILGKVGLITPKLYGYGWYDGDEPYPRRYTGEC